MAYILYFVGRGFGYVFARLVKLVYTTDLKFVPFTGYWFKSGSEHS